MKLLLIILVLFCQIGLSAVPYNSKVLKTKDYEAMRDILNKYIKNSQVGLSDTGEGGDEAISILKKGLKVLLMRPDTDAVKSSLILILQNEIIKYRSFMAVLREVIEESTDEFKSKKGSIAYQASLLYLIENSIAYLKSINNKESYAVLKNITNAKLKISKKISNYLLLDMGRGKTASPSYLANEVLEDKQKELKIKKAKMEKIKKMVKKQNKRKPSSTKTKNLKKSPKPTSQINL